MCVGKVRGKRLTGQGKKAEQSEQSEQDTIFHGFFLQGVMPIKGSVGMYTVCSVQFLG
jgi:hypothetical protein